MRRLFLGLGLVGGVALIGTAALVLRRHGEPASAPATARSTGEDGLSLSHAEPVHAPEPVEVAPPAMAGLDLVHIALADGHPHRGGYLHADARLDDYAVRTAAKTGLPSLRGLPLANPGDS